MRKRIGALLAFAGLFAALTQVHAQGNAIQPSQTFTFMPNAYGCVSKDKFDSADQHAKAGESQKMQEFFSGFECLSTPQDARFRVLRVEGHDVEFVNASNSDTQGLWTADRFIRQ
jgi:hypothetical protein